MQQKTGKGIIYVILYVFVFASMDVVCILGDIFSYFGKLAVFRKSVFK